MNTYKVTITNSKSTVVYVETESDDDDAISALADAKEASGAGEVFYDSEIDIVKMSAAAIKRMKRSQA